MNFKSIVVSITTLLLVALFLSGCTPTPSGNQANPVIDRTSKIPATATKYTPQTDVYPPKLHSRDFQNPEPLSAMINTAGAEDSPFVLPDGNTLYFFFTPDVKVPAEKQLLDQVTGIYVARKTNGEWGKAERVWLQDPGKLALDGCEFVQGEKMWFCSAREGYTDIHWFTAENNAGVWENWQQADFDTSGYEVGELHINQDQLYFHSARAGGKGQLDIWVSAKKDGSWQRPENISVVNSGENDGWPYLTEDGKELWFLRTYLGSPAIYRSRKVSNKWQKPELIISQFAGEPSLDSQGNLYFVHHYYNKQSEMLEADIYLAKRK